MFWSSITSIRRKTTAAPRPIPAAPAMPSMVGPSPEAGQQGDRGQPDQEDRREHDGLERPVEQPRSQREEEHEDRFEQAQLDRARDDRRDVGHVVVAAQLPPPISCRLHRR